MALLESVKPGFAAKYESKAAEGAHHGFVSLMASRLWGDALASTRAATPALATLDRSRPAAFTNADSGLVLLACQLLMLGDNLSEGSPTPPAPALSHPRSSRAARPRRAAASAPAELAG